MSREEDLTRIAKKLDKMVSRNNTDGALDLLKELKGFNMTLKLLQETRIGMSVNGIRKHCTNEEVISLAKVLIKDWKRLLETCHSNSEKMKNGFVSEKPAAAPHSSPSETQSSHRRLDAKHKHGFDPENKQSDKTRKEKRNDMHMNTKNQADDLGEEKHLEDHQNVRHLYEIREEKQTKTPKVEMENEKQKPTKDLQSEKTKSELYKERSLEDLRRIWHLEHIRKEKQPEEPKKHPGDVKDSSREEIRRDKWISTQRQEGEPVREKPLFERRGVLDSRLLYPSRFPSPPRPAQPPATIKRSSLDMKKDRKDGRDSSFKHSPPSTSPPAKRPVSDVKKERKIPPDPNLPLAPLPLHLHPPSPRKEPPDPNAPLPPLPLHLHPPPAPRHSSLDGKKDRDRKSSADVKPPAQKKPADVKKDKSRKDSVDSKEPKKHSDDVKRERHDSSDCKLPPSKKPNLEGKKDKHRKDSSESKPCPPAKRPSTDSKPDRRESTDSKKSSSPPAKKLTGERRDSLSSKPPQPGPPQRKLSTDSTERKGKTEAPRSPTTPTSPMSPSFCSPGGPLSPHLSTGDSIRDKCIEMLSAALRTDNDYKDFGANCDSMAAEIEDHIYQEIKATDMKYKNRVRSRISNLKDPKNPGLRKNVLAGNIELSRIATMSAEEMASDELKQLRNVLTQEAIREHQMAKTGGTTTDLLQCGKCKKKNCTYNQVQTRSADEPMTTFVLCNECGNRWKFC